MKLMLEFFCPDESFECLKVNILNRKSGFCDEARLRLRGSDEERMLPVFKSPRIRIVPAQISYLLGH